MSRSRNKTIEVEALTHKDAKRRNIPTAEFESLMWEEEKSPAQLVYQRRNRDLDPQLVWRGKDEQDWSDLIVQAPSLYIQEKVHPKVLIDDVKRESKERAKDKALPVPDLFGDFNGLHDLEAKTEFYQHDQNWSNRMILGDSLSVMASLAEREGLHGQVQCIYIDPSLWHQVQLEFPVVDHLARREGRSERSHHARAGTDARLPRHLARWRAARVAAAMGPHGRGGRRLSGRSVLLATSWPRVGALAGLAPGWRWSLAGVAGGGAPSDAARSMRRSEALALRNARQSLGVLDVNTTLPAGLCQRKCPLPV